VLELLRLGVPVSLKQGLFLAAGGIRGSLSLVLAQTIATLATDDESGTVSVFFNWALCRRYDVHGCS
jgi:NhaP-type Na+/H+ or K+/H+ antiporter